MTLHSDLSPLLLNDEEMDALQAVLVSDDVPDDCMDLEMLDGFLAGVLLSPQPIACENWLPEVWSAYGQADFGTGHAVRRAIRLVLGYYNELATTIGRGDEDGCWTPFCFAAEEGGPGIGDVWFEGFTQAMDIWPSDWQDDLPGDVVADVQNALQEIIAAWEGNEAANDETRLIRLDAAGRVINAIFARWRSIGLPAPQPLEVEKSSSSKPQAGRNEPCPCGSGKKYKKCCGAGDE